LRKFALTSTGPISGKSTLAKYLEREHNFIRADHSHTLVSHYVDRWNVVHDRNPISMAQFYAYKDKYRPDLQEYGYKIGFNDTDLSSYWMTKTLSAWLESGQSRDVVFDSFRGELQAQVLRDMGFELVQLSIPTNVRMDRAWQLGMDFEQIRSAMSAHPELELGIANPDVRLRGDLPVEEQARILLHRPQGRRLGVSIFGSEI